MDDVTLGELARRMDLLHGDVKELRGAIVEHDDLRAAAGAWHTALQAHENLADRRMTAVETRMDRLDAWHAWALRIVLGAVLVALLALVLSDPGVVV